MEEQRVGTAYGDAGVSYEREGANPRHAEWWQQIQHCRKHFVSDASVEQALQFTPRSGDLFVCTPAKSGTTWMMQMCYQMATGGDMSFGDLTEVVPWIELALDLELDLERDPPRIFKSHLPRQLLPFVPAAKYIIVVRNPLDVAVSFFRFFQGWFADYDDSFFPFFVEENMLVDTPSALGRCLGHIKGWLPHVNDENVLIVAFEQMKRDHDAVMRKVAEFAGFASGDTVAELKRGTAASWDELVHYCSFSFMKEHQKQFDDNLITQKINPRMGLPVGKYSSKVRTGGGGQLSKEELLTPEMVKRIEDRFAEVFEGTAQTSYGSVLETLKEANGLEY